MGDSKVMTLSKSEKSSSAVQLQEQSPVNSYSDWSAMQAYYGPGMMPQPYFSTSFVPSHAPHPSMWLPWAFILPFGSPYTAMYPHAVYSHPSFPFGNGHYAWVTSLSTASKPVIMATPLSVEFPDKSSGGKDVGFMTKLTGFDGLAVSVGNNSIKNAADAHGNELSQSGYNSTDGSSNGSDGCNSARVCKNQRKRGSEDLGTNYSGSRSLSSEVLASVATAHTNVAGNPSGNVAPLHAAQAMLKKSIVGTPVPAPPPVVPGCNSVPSELWIQDEKQLKRERRKQSNRESARRSRLRKQAENEELAKTVESLSDENRNLSSEISELTKNSATLREENSALLVKLNSQLTQSEKLSLNKVEIENAPSVVIENFLSVIDKPNSTDPRAKLEVENSEKSNGKLCQLLDTSPRQDAVTAS